MKTAIYYFSGTGNSLFVAKELKKKIVASDIYSISKVSLLDTIESRAESVGIIFPCHFGEMPTIVESFLRKINVTDVKYIFAIVTRGGGKGNSLAGIQKILRDKKSKLNYGVSFRMQMTYIPAPYYKIMFLDNKKEEDNQEKVLSKIAKIANDILEEKSYVEFSNPVESLMSKCLNSKVLKSDRGKLDSLFSYTDRCTGCATCVKVCPVNNVQMKDGHPSWNHKCIHCMGCLQFCPSTALEYGRMSINKKRYHNLNVSVEEMESQKV